MPTTTIGGLKHYYDDVGSGEVLVMIHGATGSAHAFEPQYPGLSARFRIIAPDLRSMGRSEHVTDMPATAWVDDLGELLDQTGVGSVHLLGSSLGSRIAMRFAIDNPERVRSIIAVNPIIAITPEATERLNASGGDGNKLPPAQQHEMAQRHGDDWMDVVRNYFNIRNKPELQEFFNLRELVPQIAVPMLIVRTDNMEDLTHPILHTYELRDIVPNAHLAIEPNFGTGSVRVADDRLNELIIGFHERVVAVPAG